MASKTRLENIPPHTIETLIIAVITAVNAIPYPTQSQFQAVATAVVTGWLKGRYLHRTQQIIDGVFLQMRRQSARRKDQHHKEFYRWIGLSDENTTPDEPPNLKPKNILAKIFGPAEYEIGSDAFLHCTGHGQRIALTGPNNIFILFEGVEEGRDFSLAILEGLAKIEQDFLEPVPEEPISANYASKAIEDLEELFRFGTGGDTHA